MFISRLVFTSVWVAAVLGPRNLQAADLFVDIANPCPGTGSAADPFCSIQAGINAAVSGADTVVVAPGTYSEIIDLLGKAITVRSSAGAAGTIIDATTMSPPAGIGKPVVRCDSGETASTVLDGFTLTGGTGDTTKFSGTDPAGGGMFNDGTSPTVANCTFSGNSAHFGGGMSNFNGSPTVTNCAFRSNTAGNFAGGGMYNNGASPTVTNCTFSGNTATGGEGGGMWTFSADPMVINCTFSGNTANVGGGMWNGIANPTVTNSIFWRNLDAGGMDASAQIYVLIGTATVNYSDVQGGWTGAGSNNINADPLFVDPYGADGVLGTVDDDLRLSPGSPCIDAASNPTFMSTVASLGLAGDLDGNPRFLDDPATTDTGTGMGPIIDMGPYEFQTLSTPSAQADLDDDGDVDIFDFLTFSNCFNGALNPPKCP